MAENLQPDGQDRPPNSREQLALAALRTHRQQSGYAPWPHNGEDQLRELEDQRHQRQQLERDLQAGLAAYHSRSTPHIRRIETLSDHWPAVHLVPTETTDAPPDEPDLTVRADPELGRLAIGLGKAAEFRVWLIARHTFGRPGWAEKDRLAEAVRSAQAGASRRHLHRLLKQGEGLFWGLSPTGRVYLRSYVKVAERLTRLAVATAPELVATNVPGAPDVYIRVGGSLGAFKAQVYAGWLAHRQGPKIARQTLEGLFGCTEETLRNWERQLGAELVVVTNYAQCASHPHDDERVADHIPSHSYTYVTRQGQIRFRWRQPNSYRPTTIRQHPHKGQSRKARTQAAMAAWYPPVELCAHPLETLAFDRSHRVPRRYFATSKALKALLKRLKKRNRPDGPSTSRYVYRGQDRNDHGIWELSLDGEVETSADERMSLRREYGWWAGWQANRRLKMAG